MLNLIKNKFNCKHLNYYFKTFHIFWKFCENLLWLFALEYQTSILSALWFRNRVKVEELKKDYGIWDQCRTKEFSGPTQGHNSGAPKIKIKTNIKDMFY